MSRKRSEPLAGKEGKGARMSEYIWSTAGDTVFLYQTVEDYERGGEYASDYGSVGFVAEYAEDADEAFLASLSHPGLGPDYAKASFPDFRQALAHVESAMCYVRWVQGDLAQSEIEELWARLGDVPVNDDGEILEPFMIWAKMTHREDIWHWFDEVYDDGVIALMFPPRHSRA